MIIIDDHANADLDTLALQHFYFLIGTPLIDGTNYHATASLLGRIRVQRALDAASAFASRVDFWDYLLNNNFANLKRIIVSRPAVLKVIITEIEGICGTGFFSNDIDYENAQLTEFGRIIKRIFNYKSYRDNQVCEANCTEFNLIYCPYCNSSEAQVITETNGLTGQDEQLALLQLDHFYSQSRHPYFAVSFFNLIPGCSPCNAQLKKEKRFDIDTHFNPFHKRFDEYFQFELNNLIINAESDVHLIYSNKQPYVPNALVDFRILARYNNAQKGAIFKMYKAFKNRSLKLRNSLGQIIGLFTIADSKTERLLDHYDVPLNRNEINNVHLGKLKRDIAIQLGILNNA